MIVSGVTKGDWMLEWKRKGLVLLPSTIPGYILAL